MSKFLLLDNQYFRNGMIKEGELKDHIKVKGAYKNIAQYGLSKTGYNAMNT